MKRKNENAANIPTELLNPPKPPLAFRLGIIGHRPNRLQHANLNLLGQTMRQILQEIKNEVSAFHMSNGILFSSDKPTLRAVSPLAEGSDRIFAEQALHLGWELCCVTPFPQEEYEKDFFPENALETNSLDRFHQLVEQAKTLFQINGNRNKESSAYRFGGRVVTSQSDILIVVWDGFRKEQLGGTEDTLAEALRQNIPMIWIDAYAPHKWQWLDSNFELPDPHDARFTPDESKNPGSIQINVQGLLNIYEGTGTEGSTTNPRKDLEKYYAEKKPHLSFAFLWKLFQSLIGDSSLPKLSFRIRPFEQSKIQEWPRDSSTPVAAMVDKLRPFYAWADKLSVLYSDRYRSAFLLIFFLAAIAVAMALAPIGWQIKTLAEKTNIYAVMEFAAIVIAFLIVLLGRVRKWHERWMDYRVTAELIRHLRVVVPIGRKRPFPQVLAHYASYGNPSSTWMDWYVRAIMRSIGLPNVRLSLDFLTHNLRHIEKLLENQLNFHEKSARRSRKIEHRLHIGILILFVLTALACLCHLVHFKSEMSTFFCGFFPALGAALAGINNQGEFRRVARRSDAMKLEIKNQLNNIRRLLSSAHIGQENALSSVAALAVSSLASESAELLLNEVLDWRVVFMDRPLEVEP